MLHARSRMTRIHFALVLSTMVALAACGKLKNNSADGSTPSGAAGSGDVGGTANDGAAGTPASDGAADKPTDDGAGGNTDAPPQQADCAAVHGLPPIVTIVDATTGAPICDPTFKIEWPDGSAVGSTDGMPYGCGQTKDFDCPGPRDGGVAPCAFALLALSDNFYGMSIEVEVSKAGYQTAVVPVTSGLGGCLYVPASHPVVKLHALADGSSDGG